MRGTVNDKALVPLAGRPLFAHAAAAFMESAIADLYVVVYRDQRQMMALSAHAPTPSLLVRGGKDRQHSVIQALTALPSDIEHVFIHDCARPLVQPAQLVALHKAVRRERAVVLAHRVTDTIKQHRTNTPLRTLDRRQLWAAETPQVFARDLIIRAYARIQRHGRSVTDDAQAVEELGHPVAVIENPHPNPKLTTPADLAWLEFLLQSGGLQGLPG